MGRVGLFFPFFLFPFFLFGSFFSPSHSCHNSGSGFQYRDCLAIGMPTLLVTDELLSFLFCFIPTENVSRIGDVYSVGKVPLPEGNMIVITSKLKRIGQPAETL